MRRFYDPQALRQGEPCALGDNASHHIARVLRMRIGDELVIFNGHGGEWHSEIVAIDKRSVTIMPHAFLADNRTPPMQVRLAMPILKGERMDFALQKATELGVHQVQLVISEYSDVRLSGERLEKRLQHWQQVLISACEQCGLNVLPHLHAPLPLVELLAEPQTANSLRLIGHPGEAPLHYSILADHPAITLMTGPEGGFSADEIAAARQAGYQPFALGERVLRAETAPLTLLAGLWMAATIHQSINQPGNQSLST